MANQVGSNLSLCEQSKAIKNFVISRRLGEVGLLYWMDEGPEEGRTYLLHVNAEEAKIGKFSEDQDASETIEFEPTEELLTWLESQSEIFKTMINYCQDDGEDGFWDRPLEEKRALDYLGEHFIGKDLVSSAKTLILDRRAPLAEVWNFCHKWELKEVRTAIEKAAEKAIDKKPSRMQRLLPKIPLHIDFNSKRLREGFKKAWEKSRAGSEFRGAARDLLARLPSDKYDPALFDMWHPGVLPPELYAGWLMNSLSLYQQLFTALESEETPDKG